MQNLDHEMRRLNVVGQIHIDIGCFNEKLVRSSLRVIFRIDFKCHILGTHCVVNHATINYSASSFCHQL
jgi:hypothetical protein